MNSVFATPQGLLDFAVKFLSERVSSLKRDVQICIKETLPFPALLYCFATIDLLGSLYKGDATGDTRTYGNEVGTTRKARQYMIEIMKYPEYESSLLQDQFRHKIVHLAQPQAVIFDIKNNRMIGWMLYNKYEGKHMLVEKLPSEQPVIVLTPYLVHVDHLFTVSIEKMVEDIEISINQAPNGYLERLRMNDDILQTKFDTAIKQIGLSSKILFFLHSYLLQRNEVLPQVYDWTFGGASSNIFLKF